MVCLHQNVVHDNEIICTDCGIVLESEFPFFISNGHQPFFEHDDLYNPVVLTVPQSYLEISGKKIFDKSSGPVKMSQQKLFYVTLDLALYLFPTTNTDLFYHEIISETYVMYHDTLLKQRQIASDRKYLIELCICLTKTYLKHIVSIADKQNIVIRCTKYCKNGKCLF